MGRLRFKVRFYPTLNLEQQRSSDLTLNYFSLMNKFLQIITFVCVND